MTISLASANTNINECGTLSIANEVYDLTQDVQSNRTCFTITANGIVLDGHGYEINWSANATSTVAIFGILNRGHNNTIIKNIKIKTGKALGTGKYDILYSKTINSTFDNISFMTTGELGIRSLVISDKAENISIKNCLFNNSIAATTAIITNGTSRNITIFNNTFYNNLANGAGISLGAGDNLSLVTNNRFQWLVSSKNSIALAGDSSTVTGNIINCTGQGISAGGIRANVTNNNVVSGSYGVAVGGSYNNIFNNNFSGGFVSASGGGSITGNYNKVYQNNFTGYSNTAGLREGGNYNQVYNNTIYGGALGIATNQPNHGVYSNNTIFGTQNGFNMGNTQNNNDTATGNIIYSGSGYCFKSLSHSQNWTLIDNLCMNATNPTIYFASSGTSKRNFTAINTTVNGNPLTYKYADTQGINTMSVFYYGTFKTQNDTTPLILSNVTGFYNTGGYVFENATTNIDGLTVRQLLKAYIVNNTAGNNLTLSRYNFTAQNLGSIKTNDNYNPTENFLLTFDWYISPNCWTQTGNVLFIPKGCLYLNLAGVASKI